jgi:ATP-dependent helicase/DNAse subunit B
VKLWKRKGLLLDNDIVLNAMATLETENRMPYTRKKDGTISGELANKDQLDALRQYIFKLLGRMVDEIASGCVKPNPYTRGTSHNACSYCPYGSICHKTKVEGRRNYKAMTAQRFWEEIEKEVTENG